MTDLLPVRAFRYYYYTGEVDSMEDAVKLQLPRLGDVYQQVRNRDLGKLRRDVTSSHLERIAYNPKERVLQITFWDGSIYHYYGVPRKLWKGLTAAQSKGKYFWAYIRNKFRYERVK
jgi:hypothetical protein